MKIYKSTLFGLIWPVVWNLAFTGLGNRRTHTYIDLNSFWKVPDALNLDESEKSVLILLETTCDLAWKQKKG